jgi:hypothetical protein
MRYLVSRLLALAILVWLAACSSASPVLTCSTDVVLTVTQSSTPRLTWTPSCLVTQVAVVEVLDPALGGDSPIWSLIGEERAIAPPITYGARPSGTTTWIPARPLVAGHWYRAEVIVTPLASTGQILGQVLFMW